MTNKEYSMDDPKARITTAVLSTAMAALLLWKGWWADEGHTVGQLIFFVVLISGFIVTSLILITGVSIKLLNNMVLLCLGLPSLLFFAGNLWRLYEGAAEFNMATILNLAIWISGLVAAGMVANLSEEHSEIVGD